MTTYTFFTNPMSRGQIARWALHEVAADYTQVLVPWDDKPIALLSANPMGKVPTLIHHSENGDKTITECAAICAYLAETHPEAGLGQQGWHQICGRSVAARRQRFKHGATGRIQRACQRQR